MNHKESKTQRACVEWFKYSFPRVLITSFPNGVYIHGTQLQRVKRWNILKSEGATSGMPDLMICKASNAHHALFVEMKTLTGKISDQQKQVHESLINSGYCVKICRSLDEFILVVQKYFEN